MTAFQHVLMKRRDFLTLLLCFTVLNAKALVLWVIALGRQAKLKKIKDLPTPPHRSLSDVEWSPAVSPAGVGPGKCSPLCHSEERVVSSGHPQAWQCKVLEGHSWPADPWRHVQKALSGKKLTRIRNAMVGTSAESYGKVSGRSVDT